MKLYTLFFLVSPLLCASAAAAQASVLSLEEAVRLAQQNNPEYLRARSALRRSEVAFRGSYGAMLPSLSSGFGLQFREGRPDLVQGVSFGAASDVLSSSASASLGLSVSMPNIIGVRQARAELGASEADVQFSLATVRNTVTQAYLNALQARAQLDLQDSIVTSAEAQLRFAQARYDVSAGTLLDVRSSEASAGRARIARLRQRNAAREQLLLLFEQMGVGAPDSVVLVNDFAVFDSIPSVADLLQTARSANAELMALRTREQSSSTAVARMRSFWLPSLSLGTTLSGFASKKTDIEPDIFAARNSTRAAQANCYTTDSLRRGAGLPAITSRCDGTVFTDAEAEAIRAANTQYPFGFSRSPMVYSVSISFPVFNNFIRENNIQNAELARSDARVAFSQAERRLSTQIETSRDKLVTQVEAVRELQVIRDASREAVALSQERYRIGTGSLLELSSARSSFEQASAELVGAVFEFHRILSVLEAAVGRRLR